MFILKLVTIIFLTLFIWLVFRLFIGIFKVVSFVRSGMQAPFNKQQAQPQQTTMVKCNTCNLYILDTEALSRNGVYFCSPEHVKK